MNPRRLESQSRALPTELHPPLFLYLQHGAAASCLASHQAGTCQTPVWRSLNCESPLDFRFQLTQLSYTHHCSNILLDDTTASCLSVYQVIKVGGAHPTNCTEQYSIYSIYMARPAGFEPATLGLAYQLRLSTPHYIWVCGLDYLFTITGVARIVSTDPLIRPVTQVSSGLPSAQIYFGC